MAAARGAAVDQLPALLKEPRTAGSAPGGSAPATTPEPPAPQPSPEQLVAPSSPDALRAQLPATLPDPAAIAEDIDDTRTPDQKTAAAQQEAADLRTVAGEHRAGVREAASGHQQSVRDHGSTQRSAVRVSQTAKAAALGQQAAASRAALTGAAEQEKAALRAGVVADVATAAAATSEKVAAARAAIQARRQSMTDAADSERTSAAAAAEAESGRAVGELESAALACEQAGEAEAARFTGNDDPAPDQRGAARQVGRESAADIRAKKAELPGQLRARAVEHGQRCTDYVRDVLSRLGETERALVAEIQQAGTQTQAAIREGLSGSLGAVDARLTQDLAAVEATATAARASLDTAAAQVGSDLDRGVAGAVQELDTAAAAVGHDLDRGAEETSVVITETERPFLPGVQQQVAAARGSMTSAAEAARAQLGVAAGGAGTQFASVAQSFSAAADTLLAQFGEQQGRVRDGFTAGMGQLRAGRAQSVAALMAGLAGRQQGVTDAVLTEVDTAATETRGRLAEMGGQFRTGIRQAADASILEATRPKTDDVTTRAREAGEQVDDGWLAGLGRALVQIAIGLIVLVVVALIVAAIVAAFGVVLTAWTAIMIAGAILLAVGLVFNLVQRFRQAELQDRPGLAIVMALSDTVGITGIVEGIRGKELITDRPLSAGQRTERGVLGAVTLIGLILGARSAIKGPPGGAFTRPVELPAGIFGRMATGVTSVAAEIASGIGRTARSVKEWIVGKDEPIGCFVPGTPVLTPTGPVAIETLASGDLVVAQDPATGRSSDQIVLHTSARVVPVVLELRLDGTAITCSPEHPFWVVGAGWRRAGDLRVGDRLRTRTGAEPELVEVRPRGRGSWTVHNLTVAGEHTYHVGRLAVLVHNKAVQADFVPRRQALQVEAQELSQRAGDAVRRAQALPEETPNLDQKVTEARGLSREARDLQSEINRSSSLEELADLEDYQASIRARLARLEADLPALDAPPPEPAPARVPFSEEAAMAELRGTGHWKTLNAENPNRTWTGDFAERMASTDPLETKQKMIVTGRAAGQPPVSYEFSVVYNHQTGQFTYIGRSGGRPPTR